MTVAKERAVDIISRMSEDKVHYVLQLLESIEGLTDKSLETDSMDISADKDSGRKLGPLAGGLVFMADDFDETCKYCFTLGNCDKIQYRKVRNKKFDGRNCRDMPKV